MVECASIMDELLLNFEMDVSMPANTFNTANVY